MKTVQLEVDSEKFRAIVEGAVARVLGRLVEGMEKTKQLEAVAQAAREVVNNATDSSGALPCTLGILSAALDVIDRSASSDISWLGDKVRALTNHLDALTHRLDAMEIVLDHEQGERRELERYLEELEKRVDDKGGV